MKEHVWGGEVVKEHFWGGEAVKEHFCCLFSVFRFSHFMVFLFFGSAIFRFFGPGEPGRENTVERGRAKNGEPKNQKTQKLDKKWQTQIGPGRARESLEQDLSGSLHAHDETADNLRL